MMLMGNTYLLSTLLSKALAIYHAKILRKEEINFTSEVYMCRDLPWVICGLNCFSQFFICLWSFIHSSSEKNVTWMLVGRWSWVKINLVILTAPLNAVPVPVTCSLMPQNNLLLFAAFVSFAFPRVNWVCALPFCASFHSVHLIHRLSTFSESSIFLLCDIAIADNYKSFIIML